MRGGDSEATVTASNEEIDSPIAYEIEMAIVTSPTMFRVIEKRVKPGGVMLVDNSIITETAARDDIAVYYIPASRIATERIGVPLASNLVLMGAYLEATGIIPYDVVEEAITESLKGTTKEQYLEVNLKALSEGRQFVRELPQADSIAP
jgi:2-oxoglutarate ferredoxin oxidoreductase subunit gamma